MNKRQRQELEDAVRQLAEEPYNPSEEHIEEVKQRAFEEYGQRMAAKQKTKEKRKGTLRRAVVTAAAIVCLLVGSGVISLLNPLQSGNADNFFRRAVIWVNEQLHLGIELPMPKDENKAQFHEGYIISSISDIAETIDFPIVCFQDKQDLHFDEIIKEEEPFSNETMVILKYTTPDGMIRIVNQSGSTFSVTSINSDAVTTIQTEIGNIHIYEADASIRGLLTIDNVNATIIGTMSLERFIYYCQGIHLFN